MWKLPFTFLGAVAALLAVPLIAVGATTGPSPVAIEDVPAPLLSLYRDAATERCPGLPWSVLAAIGKVESDHGRSSGGTIDAGGTVAPPIIGPVLDGGNGTARIVDTDDGLLDGDRRYDRAVGPMQFLPSTWSAYGIDASRDGVADPQNILDAIHAAAGYLCANGAGDQERLVDAVFAYNRSAEYVHEVLATAARYEAVPSEIAVPSDTLIAMVLTNPRLSIYEAGRTDIQEGRIDARVLLFLQLASERWTLAVSSLQSGHSKCVGGGDYDGCNISNHWYGRAVDIYRVDGLLVSSQNSAARALAEWALDLDGDLRPRELGNPWPGLSPLPGAFTDDDHLGHLHVGWE